MTKAQAAHLAKELRREAELAKKRGKYLEELLSEKVSPSAEHEMRAKFAAAEVAELIAYALLNSCSSKAFPPL